jgi:predicted MFS family arabinose efflux permease
MGALSIAFIATANSTIQLRVDAQMRGRVMALYAIGFLGTAPIGAPLVGWICQAANPRVALMVAAATAVVSSVVILVRHRKEKPEYAVDKLDVIVEEAEPGIELGVA